MIITKEIKDKINNVATGVFLSEGTYQDLQDGNEDKVTIWSLHEHTDLSTILGYVDDHSAAIENLIMDL